MAWPPPVLPINRTDATVQQGTHAADHNAVNGAANDIVAKILTMIATTTSRLNDTAVSVLSTAATDLGTVTSLPCQPGDLFLVQVTTYVTLVAGNASMILHLGIEASGGGVTHSAATSASTDQALLGGGSGQTLQLPIGIHKVFQTTVAGTFSAGGRGWSTTVNGGSSASMSNNRATITKI